MYLKADSTLLLEELKRCSSSQSVKGDVLLTDFDETRIRIHVESADSVRVSFQFSHGWDELKALGVMEHLKLNLTNTACSIDATTASGDESGVHLTVVVNRLAASQQTPEVARLSGLRRQAVMYPFLRAFNAVASGSVATISPVSLHINGPREPLFIVPKADRCVIVFYFRFEEQTDRAMARQIAQELTEANRHVNNAPPCTWSERDVPAELRQLADAGADVPKPAADPSAIGYLVFSVMSTMITSDAKRDQIANHFSLFRNYLLYHIKAAKSYLHARMRNRCDSLQKVLNRALPEPMEGQDVTKKTITGRTFLDRSMSGMSLGTTSAAGGGSLPGSRRGSTTSTASGYSVTS